MLRIGIAGRKKVRKRVGQTVVKQEGKQMEDKGKSEKRC